VTKVVIAVAGHSVEIEADEPMTTVAAKALYLYTKTTADADRSIVGFAPPPPVLDRAEPYTEPRPEPEELL
jgi:hypothetical protein